MYANAKYIYFFYLLDYKNVFIWPTLVVIDWYNIYQVFVIAQISNYEFLTKYIKNNCRSYQWSKPGVKYSINHWAKQNLMVIRLVQRLQVMPPTISFVHRKWELSFSALSNIFFSFLWKKYFPFFITSHIVISFQKLSLLHDIKVKSKETLLRSLGAWKSDNYHYRVNW